MSMRFYGTCLLHIGLWCIDSVFFFLLFPHRIVPTIGDLQHSSLTSSIIHCIQFQVSFWSLINILGCYVCSLWRYLTYCVWFIPVYEILSLYSIWRKTNFWWPGWFYSKFSESHWEELYLSIEVKTATKDCLLHEVQYSIHQKLDLLCSIFFMNNNMIFIKY